MWLRRGGASRGTGPNRTAQVPSPSYRVRRRRQLQLNGTAKRTGAVSCVRLQALTIPAAGVWYLVGLCLWLFLGARAAHRACLDWVRPTARLLLSPTPCSGACPGHSVVVLFLRGSALCYRPYYHFPNLSPGELYFFTIAPCLLCCVRAWVCFDLLQTLTPRQRSLIIAGTLGYRHYLSSSHDRWACFLPSTPRLPIVECATSLCRLLCTLHVAPARIPSEPAFTSCASPPVEPRT